MSKKLSRRSDARKALLRNMVTSLLRSKRIKTTETRAKEARVVTDRMITLAKRGTLHARRQALAYLLDENVVKDLFENLSVKYDDREGGYTRIVKIGPRRGDAASMVFLELVD